MSHPLYWIALQAALGIPSRKLTALMDFFGDPEGVFEATRQELCRCPVLKPREVEAILAKPYRQARAIWDECEATGITVVTPEDPMYPDGLRNIPDMPCVLYVKGRLPRLDRALAVAVVGTRKPTVYGELVCRRIAGVLATAGAVVVSGGALGLDSVAHRAALEQSGQTLAVLGCGINAGYLRENKPLREEISRHGALISEYPPKTPATRYSFPARNRLIAALSQGTVVVEAGEKSGSLITADCALEQGKDVFAVPGSVMSPSFRGSNKIIADGAIPVFSGMEVLQRYENEYFAQLQMNRARELSQKQMGERIQVLDSSQTPAGQRKKEEKPPVFEKNMPVPPPKDLSETADVVYNTLLDAGEAYLHQLMEKTGLQAAALLRELTKLELDGCITKDPAGKYNIVMK